MSPADKTKQFIKEAPLVTDALARHFVRYDLTSVGTHYTKSTTVLEILNKGFVEVDDVLK